MYVFPVCDDPMVVYNTLERKKNVYSTNEYGASTVYFSSLLLWNIKSFKNYFKTFVHKYFLLMITKGRNWLKKNKVKEMFLFISSILVILIYIHRLMGIKIWARNKEMTKDFVNSVKNKL